MADRSVGFSVYTARRIASVERDFADSFQVFGLSHEASQGALVPGCKAPRYDHDSAPQNRQKLSAGGRSWTAWPLVSFASISSRIFIIFDAAR